MAHIEGDHGCCQAHTLNPNSNFDWHIHSAPSGHIRLLRVIQALVRITEKKMNLLLDSGTYCTGSRYSPC